MEKRESIERDTRCRDNVGGNNREKIIKNGKKILLVRMIDEI